MADVGDTEEVTTKASSKYAKHEEQVCMLSSTFTINCLCIINNSTTLLNI